jgi:predicted DCC family thiol-disulfide oxidoreductase YuxK
MDIPMTLSVPQSRWTIRGTPRTATFNQRHDSVIQSLVATERLLRARSGWRFVMSIQTWVLQEIVAVLRDRVYSRSADTRCVLRCLRANHLCASQTLITQIILPKRHGQRERLD